MTPKLAVKIYRKKKHTTFNNWVGHTLVKEVKIVPKAIATFTMPSGKKYEGEFHASVSDGDIMKYLSEKFTNFNLIQNK